MSRPSKPMAKNTNSKFTTRNDMQDIFSKMAKSSKPKMEAGKRALDDCKNGEDKHNSWAIVWLHEKDYLPNNF